MRSLWTAGDIVRLYGIPRSTLYHMVEAGTLPAIQVPPKPWYSRKHYLFDPAEVSKALGEPPPQS